MDLVGRKVNQTFDDRDVASGFVPCWETGEGTRLKSEKPVERCV